MLSIKRITILKTSRSTVYGSQRGDINRDQRALEYPEQRVNDDQRQRRLQTHVQLKITFNKDLVSRTTRP